MKIRVRVVRALLLVAAIGAAGCNGPPKGRHCDPEERGRSCVEVSRDKPDADPKTVGELRWSCHPGKWSTPACPSQGVHDRKYAMRRASGERTWTIHEPGKAKAVGSFWYNGVWIGLTFTPEAQGAASETFSMREVNRSWTAGFE